MRLLPEVGLKECEGEEVGSAVEKNNSHCWGNADFPSLIDLRGSFPYFLGMIASSTADRGRFWVSPVVGGLNHWALVCRDPY